MYFYLLMAPVVVFATWLIGPYRSRAMSPSVWRREKPRNLTPQEKVAQWKGFGKVLLVVAMILGVIIGASSYSDGRTKSGIAAYNQGRYAVAEADLRQAKNFYPSEAEPHYYLGLCLLHDGNKEAAVSEFRLVCSIVAHQRSTGSTDREFAAESQAKIQQLGTESP